MLTHVREQIAFKALSTGRLHVTSLFAKSTSFFLVVPEEALKTLLANSLRQVTFCPQKK